MRHMLRPGMVLALAALAACGGDDDAPETCIPPDPEALCPDGFFFEAFVSDPETGGAVFDALVEQRGGDVGTTSAPNGRAVLCLPGGDIQVVTLAMDHATRVDTLDSCAVTRAADTAQPYPIDVVTPAFLEQLLGDVTPDPSAAQLLVSVRSYPDGTPLDGASIEVDAANDGVIELDGSLLVANVAAGEVTLSFTAPSGADCIGPATADLVPDAVNGVLFACE